jgi:methanethiol S-methyltransferase
MPWPDLSLRIIKSEIISGEFQWQVWLQLFTGIGGYVVFLVTILCAIGFVANPEVPKSIGSGVAGPPIESMPISTMLLGLFAVQHSVMAWQGFKRWRTRVISPSTERSTFAPRVDR